MSAEIHLKTFQELSNTQLYRIMQARVNIFIVEQDCVYPDLDDIDYQALHLFLQEEDEILAYCRLYWDPTEGENVAKIGRVITVRRGQGYGLELMKEAVKRGQEELNPAKIAIHAQEYACGFYEKAGFVVADPVSFLEDGIPHLHMELVF